MSTRPARDPRARLEMYGHLYELKRASALTCTARTLPEPQPGVNMAPAGGTLTAIAPRFFPNRRWPAQGAAHRWVVVAPAARDAVRLDQHLLVWDEEGAAAACRVPALLLNSGTPLSDPSPASRTSWMR
jgi:hypothetical protein